MRLSAPGVTDTATLTLVKDPRSDASEADLKAQFDLLIAIRDKLSEANNAVRTVRNMRDQVGDRLPRLSGSAAAEFRALSGDMTREQAAGEEEIYQVRNQSMEDPLNFPIKLNNQLASLTGMVATGGAITTFACTWSSAPSG